MFAVRRPGFISKEGGARSVSRAGAACVAAREGGAIGSAGCNFSDFLSSILTAGAIDKGGVMSAAGGHKW